MQIRKLIIESFATFWSESKAIISIRKDPLYKSLGKLIWGRFWFVYLLLAVIGAQSHYCMMLIPRSFFDSIPDQWAIRFLIHFLAFFVWLVIPLSFIVLWSYLPFRRKNVSQLVSDLLQTPVKQESVIRCILGHSFFAFFIGYLLNQIYPWYQMYVIYSKMQISPAIVTVFFRRTFSGLQSQHTALITSNPLYQYLVNPLMDLLGHLYSFIDFLFIPMIGTLFIIGYWKERGMAFCLKWVVIIFFSFSIAGYATRNLSYYFYELVVRDQNLSHLIPIDICNLIDMSGWIIIKLIFLGYMMKLVLKRIPFSEEPQN